MIRKGDMIRFKRSGRYAAALRDEYSHRFMEERDWEMMDRGMGHLAGVYGMAVDLCYLDTQEVRRGVKVSFSTMEVISQTHESP